MAAQGAVDPARDSIEAQTALNRATDLAIGRTDLVPDLAKFYDLAAANQMWLQTGSVPPSVLSSPMPTGTANWDETQQQAEPPVTDDDIPF